MNVSMGDLQDPQMEVPKRTICLAIFCSCCMAIACSSPQKNISFNSFDRSQSYFFLFWAFRLTTTSLSDLVNNYYTVIRYAMENQ